QLVHLAFPVRVALAQLGKRRDDNAGLLDAGDLRGKRRGVECLRVDARNGLAHPHLEAAMLQELDGPWPVLVGEADQLGRSALGQPAHQELPEGAAVALALVFGMHAQPDEVAVRVEGPVHMAERAIGHRLAVRFEHESPEVERRVAVLVPVLPAVHGFMGVGVNSVVDAHSLLVIGPGGHVERAYPEGLAAAGGQMLALDGRLLACTGRRRLFGIHGQFSLRFCTFPAGSTGRTPSAASAAGTSRPGRYCTACMPTARAASTLARLSSTKTASAGCLPRRSRVR